MSASEDQAGKTTAQGSGKRGWLCVPAVAAGLLAVTTILWRCWNAPPGTVGLEFPFDLVFYYYPMLQQAGERLRAGELPLWNPWQCCGVPFMATAQVAIFYPPTWLILVLPVGWTIKTLMFGQVFLGGLFAACFFRSLGKGWFAATFGGALYLFGCMLGQTYWPSQVSTLVWLPFLMWTVERYIQTGLWRWWAAFTVGVAVQALAGFPQFFVYTFYLLIPYALLRLAVRFLVPGEAATGAMRQRAASFVRTAALLGGGGALAAGLAAIQLIPTAELARNTARVGRLDERAIHYLEAERDKYLTLDRFFHNVFDPSAKMITFDFPDGSGYLGMMTPLLIVLGLGYGRRDHRAWFFAAVAIVSFMLAFGYSDWSGWAYRLYAHLPTGNMFRTPSRFLLLTYFSLITIAVYGLDAVTRPPGAAQWRWFRPAIIASLTIGLMFTARNLADVPWTTAATGLAAGAGGLVLCAALAVHRPTILLATKGLILALLIFDLSQATATYNCLRDIPIEWSRQFSWARVSPLGPEPVAAAAAEAGLNRVALPFLQPMKMIEPPSRFYSVTDYEPLLPERWYWANQCLHGVAGFIMCTVDPAASPAFYDMASVSHLFRTEISPSLREQLTPKQWTFQTRVPRPALPGIKTTLESRPSALPRAYTVGHYELIQPVEAVHRFIKADWDYRDGALIEQWEPMPKLPDAVPGTKRRPAEIVSYSPQRVVVRAAAAEPRLLVLTDTFFPGWEATVDGVPTRIVRANYLFRAVPISAGSHEVVFEYRPASFRLGAAVSFASMAALAAVLVAAHLKRRRGRVLQRPTSASQ